MGMTIGFLAAWAIGLAAGFGFSGSVALGLAGLAVGGFVDRSRSRVRRGLESRIQSLEARLALLERTGATRPVAAQDAIPIEADGGAPVGAAATAPGPAAVRDGDVPPPRPQYGVRSSERSVEPVAEAAVDVAPDAGGARLPPWWGTLAGSLTLTRVGIVAIFFGVAFLLTWFAERMTLSAEAGLACVAAAGIALLVVGWRLADRRPTYGLSLQGAGAGIVYLVVFAATRHYDVLPPLPALALLVAVTAGTVALAWRADAQALAAIAFGGAFLAPLLVAREAGPPLPLFAWFAVLNVAIVVVAWRRSWRALVALGVVATFALAALWGGRYYTPAHFAVAQPFLLLHLALYVAVAVLEARRATVDARRPLDALVVFGVPAAAFALQWGLVADVPKGTAVAALAFAFGYAMLFLALRHRAEPGLRTLAWCFLALAAAFATAAIPFAFDARGTSAWWALEAAAAYALACRQRQRWWRAVALVLHACAVAAFLAGARWPAGAPLLAHAGALGALMLGTAALVQAWAADRWRDALGKGEVATAPVLVAWGLAWWLGTGVFEVLRVRPGWLGPGEGTAALTWVTLVSAGALAVARAIVWPRLAWGGLAAGAATIPAFGVQVVDAHTTLLWPGALVWPAAWLVQAFALRAIDGDPRLGGVEPRPALGRAIALSAVAFVAWASFEDWTWTRRVTPAGSAWALCAALAAPILAVALAGTGRWRQAWPSSRHPRALADATVVLAGVLVACATVMALVSRGDPAPLPWWPLANPLDLAVAAAFFAGGRAALALGPRAAEFAARALPVALFVAGNGLMLRIAHHWGGVPWRAADLMASKPLQAAITLAWTAVACILMIHAARRGARTRWMLGAGLLAIAVVKLFLVDLAALSGLARIVAFLGVGGMLVALGYVAPPPPSRPADAEPGQAAASSDGSTTPDGPRSA